MSTKLYANSSPLFLVRLWVDAGENGDGGHDGAAGPGGDGEAAGLGAPRGKVLHVVSGEAHYFESWADLIALMQAMLSNKRNAYARGQGSGARDQSLPESTDP